MRIEAGVDGVKEVSKQNQNGPKPDLVDEEGE